MTKTWYCRFQITLEVPFFDVDSMNIVWHGHYVKYLELARCAFLDAVGYNYTIMRQEGFAWPVVQMQLKYVRPARFGQQVVVELALVEYESCLRLDYVISDAATGERLTKASTTQVAVCMQAEQMQFQTPCSWQQAIEHYLSVCNAHQMN